LGLREAAAALPGEGHRRADVAARSPGRARVWLLVPFRSFRRRGVAPLDFFSFLPFSRVRARPFAGLLLDGVRRTDGCGLWLVGGACFWSPVGGGVGELTRR